MVSKRDILNAFKPDSTGFANSEIKGGVGFDNARENIDPHVKTKVLDAKEIRINNQNLDARYVNVTGDTMTGNLNAPGFEFSADTIVGTNAVSTQVTFFAQDMPGINADIGYTNDIGGTGTLSFVGGILVAFT